MIIVIFHAQSEEDWEYDHNHEWSAYRGEVEVHGSTSTDTALILLNSRGELWSGKEDLEETVMEFRCEHNEDYMNEGDASWCKSSIRGILEESRKGIENTTGFNLSDLLD